MWPVTWVIKPLPILNRTHARKIYSFLRLGINQFGLLNPLLCIAEIIIFALTSNNHMTMKVPHSPTKKIKKPIVQQKHFQHHFTRLLLGGNLHTSSAPYSFQQTFVTLQPSAKISDGQTCSGFEHFPSNSHGLDTLLRLPSRHHQRAHQTVWGLCGYNHVCR
jgi:hypothetical protein